MGNRFFKPYIGKNYHMGFFNGKKVLVLGASHYCTYNNDSKKFNCPVWDLCTSKEKKDSSAFNETCPYNEKYHIDEKLENSTCLELENFLGGDNYLTYQNFTMALMDNFGIVDKQSVWDKLAFVNYVQYFLPSTETPIQTKIDERNFDALLETVDELSPDIIIIWGTKVTNHFKKKYIKKKVSKLALQSDDYFWKMEYGEHKIIIVNPYHPSDMRRHWSRDLFQFVNKLKLAISMLYENL